MSRVTHLDQQNVPHDLVLGLLDSSVSAGPPCRVRKGTGSQLVVVCASQYLEARVDSGFYRDLLKL